MPIIKQVFKNLKGGDVYDEFPREMGSFPRGRKFFAGASSQGEERKKYLEK